MRYIKWLLIGTALTLTPACLCESELCRAGSGGIAIGGSGSSAPSRPMVPPVNYSGREQHGVVKPSDCKKMEQRFRAQGRRVRLVAAKPNQFNQGGGVLKYICIFEGEDASEEATPFEDERFPKSEYDYP